MHRSHQLMNMDMQKLFASMEREGREEVEYVLHTCGPLPPLYEAVKDGSTCQVKRLVESGCDVNSFKLKFCLTYTPLHMAVRSQHLDIVRILLDAGANVNTVIRDRSPLMQAVEDKNIELVKLLVEKGHNCNVNLWTESKECALQLAASADIDIFEYLLKHGAKIDCFQNRNMGSKGLTKMYEVDISFVELLVKYRLNTLDCTLFLYVALLERTDIVELILANMEDPFTDKAFGEVMRMEDESVWLKLAKIVIKPYCLATKCSKDNKLLLLILNFCKSQIRAGIQKNRMITLIRILVKYGLQIHSATTLISCDQECSCRKALCVALRDSPCVTSLKAQSCSVIRQNLSKGCKNTFTKAEVDNLKLPSTLKRYICMDGWCHAPINILPQGGAAGKYMVIRE